MFGQMTSSANQSEKIRDEEQQQIEKVDIATGGQESISENDMGMSEGDSSKQEDVRDTDDEEGIAEEKDYSELLYYLNYYLYEKKVQYLENYTEYIKKTVDISKDMLEMGEITENMAHSYEVQLINVEAELTAAKNEKIYCSLYLQEKELDFSDYNIEEMKSIRSKEYYKEKYPEKDYMTMVRHITDYENAVVYIQAKKREAEYITENIEINKLLFQEGEISEMELIEAEMEAKKIQYEMAEYYVEMNKAYWNLELNSEN